MGFWALLARSRCRRGMELVSLRLWFGASSALPACPVFGILLLFWTIRCPVVIVFGGGSILRGGVFFSFASDSHCGRYTVPLGNRGIRELP